MQTRSDLVGSCFPRNFWFKESSAISCNSNWISKNYEDSYLPVDFETDDESTWGDIKINTDVRFSNYFCIRAELAKDKADPYSVPILIYNYNGAEHFVDPSYTAPASSASDRIDTQNNGYRPKVALPSITDSSSCGGILSDIEIYDTDGTTIHSELEGNENSGQWYVRTKNGYKTTIDSYTYKVKLIFENINDWAWLEHSGTAPLDEFSFEVKCDD